MSLFNTEDKEALKKEVLIAVISAVAGAIVSGIISAVFNNITIAEKYIDPSSYNVLIKTNLVDTALVSEDILEQDISEQFQTIASTMAEQNSQLGDIHSQLKDAVEKTSEEDVPKGTLSDREMVTSLVSRINDLKVKLSTQDSLNAEVDQLKQKIEEYKAQKTADVRSATLVVDGLTIETSIPNMVAVIEDRNYYSESIISTVLGDTTEFDSENAVVRVGREKAEKTILQNSMITDSSNIEFYTSGEGSSFTMGTEIYDNGFTSRTNWEDTFLYANLRNQYSKISFKAGHIDGTDLSNRTLFIYTKNNNEDYILKKKIVLSHEMFPETTTVELNYATGLKMTLDGDTDAKYGFTDVYLYR